VRVGPTLSRAFENRHAFLFVNPQLDSLGLLRVTPDSPKPDAERRPSPPACAVSVALGDDWKGATAASPAACSQRMPACQWRPQRQRDTGMAASWRRLGRLQWIRILIAAQ
jgi:hypothetical protein